MAESGEAQAERLRDTASSAPKVVEMFLTALSSSGASVNTIQTYSRILKRLRAAVGDTIDDLGESDLRRYIRAERRRGLRASTIALAIAALRAFFAHLVARHVRPDNPAQGLKRPRVRSRRRSPSLDQSQVSELLESFAQTTLGSRDQCIVELLYSGVRASEIGLLLEQDVTAAVAIAGDVQLRFLGGGGRKRQVTLGPRARSILVSYVENARPTLARASRAELVLSRTGNPIDRRDVWRAIRRGLRRAGLPSVSPSGLQRSFAIHAMQFGEPLGRVSRSLGHARTETTRRLLGEYGRRETRRRRQQRRLEALEARERAAARKAVRAARNRGREARASAREAEIALDAPTHLHVELDPQPSGRGVYLAHVARELERGERLRSGHSANKIGLNEAPREALERHYDECVRCWNYAFGEEQPRPELCRRGKRLHGPA